ncbi:YciI family protein [Catenulispora yoronensis]|uniref:YciI family protein n=1 Tax=Catenulispora yoronensis TaxID=450799 RepID=A0ABN2V6J2_9ACTN
MKYLLLINNDPATLAALSEQEQQELMSEVESLMAEISASGELLGGQALADASQTKTVRVRGGSVTATDGPFAEAKECLAGTLMVECETVERAVEIASRWPDAKFGAMEVRPIIDTF